MTNLYDSLLRRSKLSILNSPSSILASTACGYDAASRLLTVSDGTNSAAYSYLANSPLVGQIVFANNGAMQMTATKTYDNLHPVRYGVGRAELSHGVNRLTEIVNGNGTVPPADQRSYAYNSANFTP